MVIYTATVRVSYLNMLYLLQNLSHGPKGEERKENQENVKSRIVFEV